MSQSSTRLVAIRIVLLAGVIQSFTLACDSNGPTQPDASSQLALPNSAMYGLIPGGLTASAVAWNQISLAWSTMPSATGYELWRSTTGPTGAYTNRTNTLNTNRFTDGELTGGTQYCYEVRSVKIAGKNVSYSALSSPVCATTFPPPVAAPSETDALPQGYYVLVKWKDNSSNEDGFHIQHAPVASEAWTYAQDAAANAASSFIYVGLEQPTCFRVIAFNSAGPSNPSAADCTTVPAPPSGLSTTGTGQPTITLVWTDNSRFEDGYRVSRSANGAAWTDIANLPANTLTYEDKSAANDVRYWYVVRALKDGGFSEVSNQITGLISTTAPAAPANPATAYYLDTEGYGWNYLVVWWTDASENEAGFRVEYSADGKTGWTPYSQSEADVNYIQQVYDAYGPPPPGGCYRVIAWNNIGDSNPSEIACLEPGVFVADLSAAAIDQQEIDLTWTDISTLEINYVILRSTEAYGIYDWVGTAAPGLATYQDKGLASGQEYWYMVVPVYPGGSWGDYSNMASATTTTTSGATNRITGTVLPAPTPRTPIRVRGVPLPPRRDLIKAPRTKKK